MQYVLETDQLTTKYRSAAALCGLTMRVPKGAIYGLIGRNGAGKTTLIRLVCGLQNPSGGSYTLFGEKNDSGAIGRSRRRMGAVVENPAICLDMTAAGNLRQQYALLGLPSDEGISELLKLVGLSSTGSKKARNFSLGMRQRLGIAVALAGNPDFLLLDEPTNGLDPEGIIEIRELILKLNRERGITVLISSHILGELSKLATYYGFVDGGRMIRELSADELEAECGKRVTAEVSDVRILARVLDLMKLKYRVISDSKADIYGEVVASELFAALEKQSCRILKLTERDESLEGYYMNLFGGGHNA